MLYFGTLPLYSGQMDEQMAARLIGFIRDVGTRPAHEFIRVRAVGLALKRQAVLLASPPEIRLPTLAAHAVRAGAGYLGDEMVKLDPILRRAYGYPLPLLVDSEEAARIPGVERPRPRGRRYDDPVFRAAWGRYPVRVEELGGRPAEPAPIGWIVLPYFEQGATTRLEPMGGAAALFRFTESILNMHVWRERALAFSRDLMESVPVSRLVVGSVGEAADEILGAAPSVLEGVMT